MEGRIIVGCPGEDLARIIEEQGMNQNKLAEQIGMTRQAVQQTLNRRKGTMRVSTMAKIAEALGWRLVLEKM